MYPHTINIDWLQIYLHDENQGIENLAMIYNGKSSYEFKKAEYTSRQETSESCVVITYNEPSELMFETELKQM